MAIRIGINPIGWSNDDMPELGGATTLSTCLREACEAGYEGVELGSKFPREAAALRDALAPFGLACVSGWYGGELLARSVDDEIERSRAHRGLLRAMGCDVVVFAEVTGTVHPDRSVPLSRRPTIGGDDWAAYGARLTALAEAFAADGLRLAFHHHMGTVVQTGDEIAALMGSTGLAVHLLLDTGHATWGGADPADLAGRYADRIAHVHAKDVRAGIRARADREDWSFLDAVLAGVFTVPGDGAVDTLSVLRALGGYSGWIVVEAEQDPAQAEPLAYARLGRETLRRLLAEAGLRR